MVSAISFYLVVKILESELANLREVEKSADMVEHTLADLKKFNLDEKQKRRIKSILERYRVEIDLLQKLLTGLKETIEKEQQKLV